MSNIMEEALGAIESQIQTSPEKVPAGKTVIGIQLERDPARSGKFITAVDQNWLVTGIAVAIKDGHVLAGNHIFGRFTNGTPKVTACHFVTCTKCGNRVLMPIAVWEAKDLARKQGIEIKDTEPGMSVLKAHGHCSCGGAWTIDKAHEKDCITRFTEKVLDAISTNGSIPSFLPPLAFAVAPLVGEPKPPISPEWIWLTQAMAKNGKAVSPFKAGERGDVVVFNPGFWLGYVDDHNATGLFWVENGKSRSSHFNPMGLDGL